MAEREQILADFQVIFSLFNITGPAITEFWLNTRYFNVYYVLVCYKNHQPIVAPHTKLQFGRVP